jgi:hypothetical protein
MIWILSENGGVPALNPAADHRPLGQLNRPDDPDLVPGSPVGSSPFEKTQIGAIVAQYQDKYDMGVDRAD